MKYLWMLILMQVLKGGKGHEYWSSAKEQQKGPWVTTDAGKYQADQSFYKVPQSHSSLALQHQQKKDYAQDHSPYIIEAKDVAQSPYQYQLLSEDYANPPPKEPVPGPQSYETYDGEPATWPCFYKECGGKRQSPINIDTEVIQFKSELGPLSFHNYDLVLENLLIGNFNGGSVYIDIPVDKNVMVTSKWLKSSYRLFRMAFIWSRHGSLHTVDSKYFPMELILTHLNTKYDSPNVDQPDTILNLNVFFNISKVDNEALNPIIETFGRINYPGANTTLTTPIRIADYLPQHLDAYVTYNGSVILPPCKETRIYIIFDYTNSVSEKQLQQFRILTSTTEKRLKPEHSKSLKRPVQALNNREIWGSIPSSIPKEQHILQHPKQQYYHPWK